jgi:hypothetical protein
MTPKRIEELVYGICGDNSLIKGKVRAALKEAAGSGEAPREGWIPVSERLPEIDMSKATYERGTKVLMAWGPSQQNVGEGHYTANWYSKQAKALAPKFYWQGRIAPWKITHWMHFPAGPGRSPDEGK